MSLILEGLRNEGNKMVHLRLDREDAGITTVSDGASHEIAQKLRETCCTDCPALDRGCSGARGVVKWNASPHFSYFYVEMKGQNAIVTNEECLIPSTKIEISGKGVSYFSVSRGGGDPADGDS